MNTGPKAPQVQRSKKVWDVICGGQWRCGMALQGRDLLASMLGAAVERSGRGGQAKVAKVIGYSSATVCLAMRGKYAGNIEKLLKKMQQAFPAAVGCPVLGSIEIARCVEERRKPFGAASGFAARLRKACGQCEYNAKGGRNASGDKLLQKRQANDAQRGSDRSEDGCG